MILRLEVAYRDPSLDSRTKNLIENWKLSSPKSLQWVDVYWIKSTHIQPDLILQASEEILLDQVLHQPTLTPKLEGTGFLRTLHPGMTDNRARTLKEALSLYFTKDQDDFEILTGDMLILNQRTPESEKGLSKWSNPWIQNLIEVNLGKKDELAHFENSKLFKNISDKEVRVEKIELAGLNGLMLQKLSKDRLLALSLTEMKAVQAQFALLKRPATDVELEIIAQTWSEHCKHKIFAAQVTYEGEPTPDGKPIPKVTQSLFKSTIANVTENHTKPWLLSVFKDNSGIIQFTDTHALCMKVETHNSPSALDPLGGAITGIVGVNRDILGSGVGAKPIFNTNVFCVGHPDYSQKLPPKIHHPKDLLEGVRKGVEEGGNQSGIPTINGAVCFDDSFLGKPLIFVGSGGILPLEIAGKKTHEKRAKVGDLIYMVGGRIGKDGVHGATFSSMALEDDMPSSVVQLGDPITQKRMTDFLMCARDQDLYETLTDNGAGGLSSSVGEIADITGGAAIDISLAKTKYPGLQPWERMISESQERMTVIVDVQKAKRFESLADDYSVDYSLLGEMNSSGSLKVLYKGDEVANLDLKFLHSGCPKMELNATYAFPNSYSKLLDSRPKYEVPSIKDMCKAMISRPNIASKESIIRQYDHEVQGCSVIKPLQGLFNHYSPNDASVSRISVESNVGVVVSCGLQPEWSKADPYLMAQLSVDEAVRNALCAGAEYSSTDDTKVFALLDNFCWPDPTEKTETMGALVRACYGMKEAADALKLPFVSGKDSMKNDYRGETVISVVPTLLISAIARMNKVSTARSAEFKKVGDHVYLLGSKEVGLIASEWMKLGYKTNGETLKLAKPNWTLARNLYNWLGSDKASKISSLHDCSEGGLITALIESCFTNKMGVKFHNSLKWNCESLFGEGFHRFIGSVSDECRLQCEDEWQQNSIPFEHLGTVISESKVIGNALELDVLELEKAWTGAFL